MGMRTGSVGMRTGMMTEIKLGMRMEKLSNEDGLTLMRIE